MPPAAGRGCMPHRHRVGMKVDLETTLAACTPQPAHSRARRLCCTTCRRPRSPPFTPGCVSISLSSKSTMSSAEQPSSFASRRSSSGWCRAAAPSALPAAGAAPASAAGGAASPPPGAAAPLPLGAAAEPPSSFCLMLLASSGVHCVCLLGLNPAVDRSRCMGEKLGWAG